MPQAGTQQARGDQQHASKSDSECGSESAVEAGSDAGASDRGERSKGEANKFWDSWAQLSMVTHKKRVECSQTLESTAYNGGMKPADARYHLPHRTVDGEIYTIFAYNVEEIAKDIRHSITDRLVVKKFPEVSFEDLQGLTGSVIMLIGFDNQGGCWQAGQRLAVPEAIAAVEPQHWGLRCWPAVQPAGTARVTKSGRNL